MLLVASILDDLTSFKTGDLIIVETDVRAGILIVHTASGLAILQAGLHSKVMCGSFPDFYKWELLCTEVSLCRVIKGAVFGL